MEQEKHGIVCCYSHKPSGLDTCKFTQFVALVKFGALLEMFGQCLQLTIKFIWQLCPIAGLGILKGLGTWPWPSIDID